MRQLAFNNFGHFNLQSTIIFFIITISFFIYMIISKLALEVFSSPSVKLTLHGSAS
jgi:hypothetical protein